ncbi:MAG: hypothetical protein IIA62_05045 [Nitrospinae bacterium]|nr:hypothetical protein [Nitrospinota bacterium]
MQTLTLSIRREEGEPTSAMTIATVEEPALDESRNLEDGGKVIIKPKGLDTDTVGRI